MAITDELGAQAVQLLVATVLVQLEVAGGMKRDVSAPRASQWIRSAICWAIVPLGNTAAASRPSSCASRASNVSTSSPSP